MPHPDRSAYAAKHDPSTCAWDSACRGRTQRWHAGARHSARQVVRAFHKRPHRLHVREFCRMPGRDQRQNRALRSESPVRSAGFALGQTDATPASVAPGSHPPRKQRELSLENRSSLGSHCRLFRPSRSAHGRQGPCAGRYSPRLRYR